MMMRLEAVESCFGGSGYMETRATSLQPKSRAAVSKAERGDEKKEALVQYCTLV